MEWRSKSGPVVGLPVGIQELQFGTGRGIDAREGPNVRRSVDAVRAYTIGERWHIDAFAAAPRRNRAGSFDDGRSSTQALRGIYATRAGTATSIDLYALHFKDAVARFAQGVAHERRWTLGTRLFGSRDPWHWNWEALVQGGRLGEAAIRAWWLATDTGYRLDNIAGQPRLALSAAVGSGDRDPRDARLGALNPLYPRGNYFGDEATLGPRNFFNLHPKMTVQVSPQVELSAGLDFFWWFSTRDGVYAPSGMLLSPPGDSRVRYVATIASLGGTWAPAPGWSSSAQLAFAKPGAFLSETGADDPLNLFGLTVQYRF